MRFWLTQVGEQLPFDPGSPRLLRTGLLAEELAGRGHEVVWWASRFDYRNKIHRGAAESSIAIGPRYQIRLLRSRGFRKNLSLARVLDNVQLGRAFSAAIARETAPDLILSAYPTIELSRASVRFGLRRSIPVVVDVRDLWPEIFLRAVPSGLRGVARLGLAPLFAAARETFRSATAITGITSDIVDWAVGIGARTRSALDRDFPHGYRPPVLSPTDRAAAVEFWRARGIEAERGEFLACYLGALSSIVEFETVVGAAHLLQGDQRPIRFVVCGTGDREREMKALAAGCGNIAFTGLIGAREIWVLMEMSALGLLCYHSTFDYEASIPNKPIEYMAGGLPILSSLDRGVLRQLLETRGCGLSYQNGQPDQLAALIRACYDNRAQCAAMGAAARKVFDERFEASRVYQGMCDYLEQLGQDHGKTSGPAVSVEQTRNRG